MSPIPIVVVGRKASICAACRTGLMPEYGAIHLVTSVPQGLADLPRLLARPSHSSEPARPYAVAVGGGFDDAAFAELKAACKGVEAGIVWVRADTSKFAGMPALSDADEFGTAMARRVKAALKVLGVGEKEVADGVYLF